MSDSSESEEPAKQKVVSIRVNDRLNLETDWICIQPINKRGKTVKGALRSEVQEMVGKIHEEENDERVVNKKIKTADLK